MGLVGLVLLAAGLVLFGVGVAAPLVLRAPAPPVRRLPGTEGVPMRVVIAAWLEESVIGATVSRLRMQLAGFGPAGSDVLVVASDDATAAAAEAAGAAVIRTEPTGKAAAVNAGVAASGGRIVVLTDANCELLPDAWPSLVAQSLSGAALVSGVKTERGGAESAFWTFERRVRAAEAPRSTLSVVGEFLALRPEHYEELAPTLVDDLMTAISFDARALPVVVDPRIVTVEDATTGAEQWARRVRIARGQLVEIPPRLRSLGRTPAGRAYLWHKFWRLTLGCLGFWLAAIGFGLLLFPLGLMLAAGAVFASLAVYLYGSGRLWAPLQAATTAIALQCVVPAALIEIILSPAKNRGGWAKAAR